MTATGCSEPPPSATTPTKEEEEAEAGQFVAESDMNDWTSPADAHLFGAEIVPGSSFVPATSGPVPAWWEPPHLPTQQRRRPHLVITIHWETLMGRNDLAAELAGYGAITAQAARDIARKAAGADLLILDGPQRPGLQRTPYEDPPKPERRFGETPQTGYRPGNPLVRQVIATHQTCRAPSCTRPAEQCDLDHVIPYDKGGETTADNLIPLCRRHHLLKTFAGWTVQWAGPDEGPPGTLHWRSPLGRHYTVEPNPRPGSSVERGSAAPAHAMDPADDESPEDGLGHNAA